MDRYRVQKTLMHFASIDIGSNTLLMTIASWDDRNSVLRIVRDEHEIARLGEGLNISRIVSDASISRAKIILRRYREILAEYPQTIIRAVTTSAVRSAVNQIQVIAELEAELGVQIQVIDGEEEALLTFQGSLAKYDGVVGVLDIGGGSTEIVIGNSSTNEIVFTVSREMGAVRLKEMAMLELPLTSPAIDRAVAILRETLSFDPPVKIDKLVAVAGTPTSLAAIDLGLHEFSASRVSGHLLSQKSIESTIVRFREMKLEELIALGCVHPSRADILPAGSIILRHVMEILNITSVTVSTGGLRYGVLKDLASNTLFRDVSIEGL